MARLLGPDPNTRTAWRLTGGTFKTAAGGTAVFYADAAGSVLADIRYWDGTNTPAGTVSGSALAVDYQSQFPKFWFPNDVDVIYVSIDGGPLQEVHANLDSRMDAAVATVEAFSTQVTGLDGRITDLEAGGTGDTLLVHKAGTETITGAKTFTSPVSVPDPAAPAHAVTRSYVDNAVVAEANVRAAADDETTAALAANDARRMSDGWVRTAIRTAVDNVRMAHAAAPLTIPTYTGDEVVHPSVYYDAAGWNGYRYWMAITPYEGGDSQFENPSIVVSNDGDTWIVPPGLTNPVEPPLGGGPSVYNSDPDLVMGPGGVLYLFWRTVGAPTNYETIYYRTSTDGITWTPKVTALATLITSQRLVSPAVLYDDASGVWTMFGIDILPSPNVMSKWTATSPSGPWTKQICTAAISGRDLWHLDVVRWSGEYHMLLSDSILGGSGGAGRLYFGVSIDDGVTWTLGTNPVLSGAGVSAWDNGLYRSTMIPAVVDGELGYDVWYGGVSAAVVWQIGRSRLYLSGHSSITSGVAHGAFDIGHINVLAAMKGLSPYILGHSFSAPDSTSSVGVADTGQSATAQAGTWGISGNKAYISAAANSRLTWDVGVANFAIDVDISGVGGSDQAWVILRYVDGSNYLRAGAPIGGTMVIQTIIAGVTTNLVNLGTQPYNAHYQVVANGTTIAFYLNGALLGSATTSQFQTATLVGIQTATTAPRFDNFTVRALVNGA